MSEANTKTASKALTRDLLAFLLDDATHRSPAMRRLRTRILKAQRELRRLVDDRAWGAYLNVEKAVNAREAKETALLFRRLLAVRSARDD